MPAAEAGSGCWREAPLVFVDRVLATLVHLRHGSLTTCWSAGSAWIAPPTPGPSASCGRCSPSEGAPSVAERGHGPGRACRAPWRDRDRCRRRDPSGTADRPMQGPGEFHPRQEQAERSQGHVGHGRGRPCAAVQPDRWRFSPMPATKRSVHRPADGRWLHRTAGSRRTRPTGARRCASGGAGLTPLAICGSSTASRTLRSGGRWPAGSAAGSTSRPSPACSLVRGTWL